MIIRTAAQSDSLSIAELHSESWRTSYRGALSDKYLDGDILSDRINLWNTRLNQSTVNQHVLVACTDGKIVGFACAYLSEDKIWGSLLDNIHVSPSLHRKGIGLLLLREIFKYCRKNRPESGLYLWVLQNNKNAQDFYLHHGAQNVGTDIWNAPGGTEVPRFRFAWKPERLSF